MEGEAREIGIGSYLDTLNEAGEYLGNGLERAVYRVLEAYISRSLNRLVKGDDDLLASEAVRDALGLGFARMHSIAVSHGFRDEFRPEFEMSLYNLPMTLHNPLERNERIFEAWVKATDGLSPEELEKFETLHRLVTTVALELREPRMAVVVSIGRQFPSLAEPLQRLLNRPRSNRKT